jgi:quercetin dioxygenase-like cupin family protein
MPADFGVTRGVRGPSYTLITPANHYVSRLPQFAATTVVKLVTPRLAPARLGQYLLELAPGGGGGAPVPEPLEHFLYGLEGGATLTSEGTGHTLERGAFAYLPAGSTFHLETGEGPRGCSGSSAATSRGRGSSRPRRASATAIRSPRTTSASAACAAGSCCRPPIRRSTSP